MPANNPDIFGNDGTIYDAWQLNEAVLTIEGGDDLIAIGFQMRYARQITPYRPLNKTGTVLIAGQGTGSINLTSLVGPKATMDAFLQRYADVCQNAGNTILVQPGGIEQCAGGTNPTSFEASGCIINELQVNVQTIGELSVVTTGISMIITGLSLNPGT